MTQLTGFNGVLTAAALIMPRSTVDTVRAVRVTIIGTESSLTKPFLFGEISGLAFDGAGRLYVTDLQEPRIVVLDSTGRVVGIIGRKGEGPGEFVAPTGPVLGPDGALYVRNMTKISRFVYEARTGLLSHFDRYIDGPAMLNWHLKLPTVIDDLRRLHWPHPETPRGGVTQHGYLRYGLDGRRLDALAAPSYPTAVATTAWVRTDRGGGRTVPGLNTVPFAPLPVFAVTQRGTVVSGAGDSYLLVETDEQGRVLQRFTRKVAPLRIPSSARSDSLRALRRRIDSLPIPVARLEGTTDAVRAQRLPQTYPAYTGVVTQADGTVWVRRWPASETETVFDVFDQHAAYRFTLMLPAACASLPAPIARGRAVACMIVDPETGGESILWARVPR